MPIKTFSWKPSRLLRIFLRGRRRTQLGDIFVIETKGNITNLRTLEQAKITSTKKHFEVIDVNYKEVENYSQFVQATEKNRESL